MFYHFQEGPTTTHHGGYARLIFEIFVDFSRIQQFLQALPSPRLYLQHPQTLPLYLFRPLLLHVICPIQTHDYRWLANYALINMPNQSITKSATTIKRSGTRKAYQDQGE